MKKIIIAGPGGSGKDYFASFLESRGFKKTKDFTTRPRRDKDDNDYIFVDEINTDECYYVFKVRGNDWCYGYSKEQIISGDFSIRPPESILSTVEYLTKSGYEPYIIYFDIDLEIRRERLMKRSDKDLDRRLTTDREDFASFMTLYNPQLVIRDPYYDPEELLSQILKDIENY